MQKIFLSLAFTFLSFSSFAQEVTDSTTIDLEEEILGTWKELKSGLAKDTYVKFEKEGRLYALHSSNKCNFGKGLN